MDRKQYKHLHSINVDTLVFRLRVGNNVFLKSKNIQSAIRELHDYGFAIGIDGLLIIR